MSLINKMLHDLESRQEPSPPALPAKAVYQDLRPVKMVGRRAFPPALKFLLVVVTASAAGYVSWNWLSAGDSGAKSASVPLAATSALPAPKPRSQTVAVAAPAAAISEPAPVAPPAAVHTVATAAPSPTPEANIQHAKVEPAPIVSESPARLNQTSGARVKPAKPAAFPNTNAVVDKRVRPQTAEDTAEARYREALALVQQGRGSEATRPLAAALAAYPLHLKARELAAGLALQNGRPREAQQMLEEGLSLAPAYYPFAQLLARLYAERGADQKAVQLLEASTALAGRDPDYHALLATLYQRVGRHADAAAAYSIVLETRPQDARAWFGLGVALEAAGKPSEAAQAYRRAQLSENLPPSLATYAGKRLAALKAAP